MAMPAPARHSPPATPAATPLANNAPPGKLPPETTATQPDWRPTNRRQKLGLMALTAATVLGLVYVLQRPHQLLVAAKSARHAAACQADAVNRPPDCPGALMPVQLLPAPASAAR